MQTEMTRSSSYRSVRLQLTIIALAVSFGLAGACATAVPPTVTLHPAAPLKKGEAFYVMAVQQRDHILKSMHAAGLKTTDTPAAGAYALQVQVGSSRGSRDCGTVNNVNYIVTVSGARVMVMKGRGETGACSPTIFDSMSQLLKSYVSE